MLEEDPAPQIGVDPFQMRGVQRQPVLVRLTRRRNDAQAQLFIHDAPIRTPSIVLRTRSEPPRGHQRFNAAITLVRQPEPDRTSPMATEGWPDRVLPARSPRWLGGVASLGFGDERVCMTRDR